MRWRRCLRGDAVLTLLLGTALGLLLYVQRDGAVPATRAPRAQGLTPRARKLQAPETGAAPLAYEGVLIEGSVYVWRGHLLGVMLKRAFHKRHPGEVGTLRARDFRQEM